MAEAKVPASADFFKQLSLDCQQLKLVHHILEEMVFRGLVRGRQLGDNRLKLILEQLEILALKAKQLSDNLETQLRVVDV